MPTHACSIGGSRAGQHHLGGKLASSIIFKAILSAGIPCKANWHRKVRFPGSTCSAHLLWEAARRGARTDRRIAAASPAEMPEKAGATQKPGASSCDAVHFLCRRWRRRCHTCSRARLSFRLRARSGHGSWRRTPTRRQCRPTRARSSTAPRGAGWVGHRSASGALGSASLSSPIRLIGSKNCGPGTKYGWIYIR